MYLSVSVAGNVGLAVGVVSVGSGFVGRGGWVEKGVIVAPENVRSCRLDLVGSSRGLFITTRLVLVLGILVGSVPPTII